MAENNDTTNTTTTNNNGRQQLEEIRQLHAARFRHARATPLPPRHQHQNPSMRSARGQEEPTGGASRDNRTMNDDARERQNREEGEEQRQEQRTRTSIPNLIPGALNFGIAMAHARHALGRHMQQQQQQRHQRDGEGDAGAEGEEENVDEDMEEEEEEDENAEEEEEEIPDEDVLPKPSYLTDDHLLAAECAKTGKAPEQLEREYKDEVFARKWQMKEARMEERRQSRRAERRREREQQQQQQQQHQQQGSRVRRRDEVNERPGDSVRRRQTRIEIQVGGPNGPVFRSFMGGPGMMGMIGREGVGPEGQQQQNGIAEGDPFLEIMREVLGQRAPGEAREDVLNDNDRFERAFRNMFQSIEQQSGAMGGGQPPGFMHPGSIRGFGDLLRAMHGFAAEHANGDENLAEAPLTQQQIDAMETIVAKGDENNGSRVSCSVCLSDIESGENMKKLPCGHCYHSPCIDTWLLRSRICPTCRHDSTKPPTAAASTEAQRRSDMD